MGATVRPGRGDRRRVAACSGPPRGSSESSWSPRRGPRGNAAASRPSRPVNRHWPIESLARFYPSPLRIHNPTIQYTIRVPIRVHPQLATLRARRPCQFSVLLPTCPFTECCPAVRATPAAGELPVDSRLPSQRHLSMQPPRARPILSRPLSPPSLA